MENDPFLILILRFILFIIFFSLIAWILSRADQESERLFQLKKLWGLTKQDDESERKKTKKWLVIGYSFFLTIITSFIFILGFQIWQQLRSE